MLKELFAHCFTVATLKLSIKGAKSVTHKSSVHYRVVGLLYYPITRGRGSARAEPSSRAVILFLGAGDVGKFGCIWKVAEQ